MATTRDEAPPPWRSRLISEFHQADERATILAKALTREQLNWRPRPGEWSIGQCLEHLAVANEVYLPAMAPAITGQPAGLADEITPGWFGRWFIRKYIEPSAETTRGRAPRKITPAADVDSSVLDRLLNSNERARDFVHRASRHDVNRIRFRNPFVPLIRFTIGTGLEVLSKHQRRHLLQAERVRNSAGFPRPSESAT